MAECGTSTSLMAHLGHGGWHDSEVVGRGRRQQNAGTEQRGRCLTDGSGIWEKHDTTASRREEEGSDPNIPEVTLVCRQRISVCRLLFFKQTLYVVMTLQGADLVEGGFVATVESCFRMNGSEVGCWGEGRGKSPVPGTDAPRQ